LARAALQLTKERGRRLCVMGQLLSAPRPKGIQDVVRGLGKIQLDPTSAVARTEHLVLFSRLGRRFKIAELERMLWQERSLFEYAVEIVPIEDLAIHQETMRRYPDNTTARYAHRSRASEWLKANQPFRRYVLSELKARGPLRARELENRVGPHWTAGGWNDNPSRHVGLMLDVLWMKGEVMIVGRDGQQRIWDLASRTLPVVPRLPQREVARRLLEGQLRARGVADIKQFGWAFDGRPPGWHGALKDLVREGIAVPVQIEGTKGERYAHAEVLEQRFSPRTVLLSPFDDLISDRDHTHQLFDFFFRIEIYVPKAKRQYGYFVLPLLHGDRLIGRIDPRFDRQTRVLHVNGVYAEPSASASEGPTVRAAIDELAVWLGATDIAVGPKLPAVWLRALQS
jgi:uncharacterized protein YcaQ